MVLPAKGIVNEQLGGAGGPDAASSANCQPRSSAKVCLPMADFGCAVAAKCKLPTMATMLSKALAIME